MAHSIPDTFGRGADVRARHDPDHGRLQVRPDARGRRAGGRRPAGRAGPRGAAAPVRRLDQRRPSRHVARPSPAWGRGSSEVFARCEGRIVVTCFASNIHRVQQVVDAAAAARPQGVAGRALDAQEREHRPHARPHRHAGGDARRGPSEIEDFPDHKLVVVSTGSQGEPLSALRRMAHGDHPHVELHDGDTVIFSATPIPGNERAVNETIDRIYRLGAEVITAADVPVHASGHGYAEELKLMLNLTQPQYVMPMHGDHKRLRLHGELAEAVGVSPRRRSSAARTACRSRSTRPARASASASRRDDLRRRRGRGGHRGRGPARPPHALGRRHLHRRGHDLRAGRPLGGAARGDLPRRALPRRGATAS